MEEDMKILEELLKASKENDMYEGNKYFKSLEYFIKAYKELKEIEQIHRQENGELRKQVKELEKENKELKIIKNGIKTLEINFVNDDTYYIIGKKGFLKGEYKHLLDDYIPVSLVEEKIEELKTEHKQYENEWEIKDEIQAQIDILQELLEERK